MLGIFEGARPSFGVIPNYIYVILIILCTCVKIYKNWIVTLSRSQADHMEAIITFVQPLIIYGTSKLVFESVYYLEETWNLANRSRPDI